MHFGFHTTLIQGINFFTEATKFSMDLLPECASEVAAAVTFARSHRAL